MSLLTRLVRLFRRRRPAGQHPALRGSRWGGIWQGAPHRPLRPEDEVDRQRSVDAARQPRPWLERGPRERW